VILSDAIEGEARDAALVHAAIAREVRARDRPFTKPVAMLSVGETTVTLRAKGGKGGPNGEFALAMALAIDGSENNAGAYADGGTANRLHTADLDPRRLLDSNDRARNHRTGYRWP
jgi:hydroxypyruvate reductase